MCKAIENSTPKQQALYLEQMAKTVPFKSELVAPWVRGRTIVDLGCADASFTSWLVLKAQKVIGVDMSEFVINRAKEQYKYLDNLEFVQAKAEDFVVPCDTVIASSIFHEVFSYGNGIQSVGQAVANIYRNLNSGGRLIIRDFVKPVEDGLVCMWQAHEDIVEGHEFSSFMKNRTGFYPGMDRMGNGVLYDGVQMNDAYEFIYHKDYHDNWDTEIKETYGFATADDMKSILVSHGFKIIHSAEMDNQWIMDNRLEGKVKLWKDGKHIAFPKYQQILVAEKI